MLNRATQLSYAPGSTFKPFIALGGRAARTRELRATTTLPAGVHLSRRQPATVFHNWTTANLGTISVEQALKVSCDTVFYQFGRGLLLPLQRGPLGQGRDAAAGQPARSSGSARATGSTCRCETSGLIPDPTWKAQFAKRSPGGLLPDERSWLPGDDILMAIGSGYVTVTPLQLAPAYSALANGGKLCRPHVVDRRSRTPTGPRETVTGTATAHAPLHASRARVHPRTRSATVTQSGARRPRRSPGSRSEMPVAGKTGTAQRPPFQDTRGSPAMVPGQRPAVRGRRDGRAGRVRLGRPPRRSCATSSRASTASSRERRRASRRSRTD